LSDLLGNHTLFEQFFCSLGIAPSFDQTFAGLTQMAQLGNLSLLDSINVRDNGHFLIPAYPSIPSFLLYWQLTGKRSPTKVYDVDPQTGQGSVIFSDNGKTISAISTALTIKDQLYLSQVFDAFLLRCPLTP
jgi:hypothetical protein